MDKQQWKQMDDILQQAFELPTSERSAFLDQACNGDEAFRHEIESMLLADQQMGDFLGQPILKKENDSSIIGQHIGAYKIERQIGRGGMGVVYLASRDDNQKFNQQVAIKLIKRGMDTDEIIERFHYERRIQSPLNHPNIARFLDGGSTKDGLPYFVMEYIEGQPLLEYCQDNQLTIKARLELFLQICAAVQYAHNNLVVHRDLKPGNILITPAAAGKVGTVKLLDFGIAKLLNAEEAGLSTLLGQRPMTPEYASPEQIAGKAITTASDVYSLGVVLYELLTNQRPYQLQNRNPEEINQFLREYEPLPPSHALKNDKQHRELQGDLDNIVMMAIRKEPESRYRSVAQLAEDIERYLSGQTVIARPKSFTYSAIKFVRRHRLAVATSALILCLITASGIAYAVQAAKAASESKKAEQVSAFLVNMFRSAAPETSSGEKLTVREALELGSKRIDHELQSEPEIRAKVMNTIGEVYYSLNLYPQASQMHKQALEIRQQLFGRRHPDTAESLVNYGRAIAHVKISTEELEKLFLEGLEIQRSTLGDNHLQVAETIFELASMALYGKSDAAEAERLFRQSLSIYRQSTGSISQEVSKTLSALSSAVSGNNVNRRGEAEDLAREALQVNQQLFSPDDWRLADSKQALANILHERGKYAEAGSLIKETLPVFRATWPNGHREIANSLYWLGRNQMQLGQLQDAESSFRESYEIKRKLLPNDSDEPGDTQWNIGVALAAQGRFQEAEPLLKLGFSIRHRKIQFFLEWATQQSHWELQSLYDGWGKHERLVQHLTEYEGIARKKLAENLEKYGENHIQTGAIHERIAETLLGLGKLDEAEASANRAQQIAELHIPGGAGSTIILLGQISYQRGQLAKAQSLFERGVQITKSNQPEDHLAIATGNTKLGSMLIQQRRFEEAERLLLDSLQLLTPIFNERDYRTQETIRNLTKLYRVWGKPEKVAEYRSKLIRH